MKEKMIEWYNESLEKYGPGDFRSLTWADAEGTSAYKRYQQMDEVCPFEDNTIIEVGCGWGSFFDFEFTTEKYVGYDINEKFIKIAKEKHPNRNFFVLDISEEKSPIVADLVICSGVAGNQGGPADHPLKLKKFLKDLSEMGDTVLVNFPSSWSTIRAKNIEYFSPESVLSAALDITPNVTLYHKSMADFLIKMELA